MPDPSERGSHAERTPQPLGEPRPLSDSLPMGRGRIFALGVAPACPGEAIEDRLVATREKGAGPSRDQRPVGEAPGGFRAPGWNRTRCVEKEAIPTRKLEILQCIWRCQA